MHVSEFEKKMKETCTWVISFLKAKKSIDQNKVRLRHVIKKLSRSSGSASTCAREDCGRFRTDGLDYNDEVFRKCIKTAFRRSC